MPASPGQPDSLRELAERAARAEHAAFERLHARLDAPLHTLFRRRGADAALSDELVQQTWTRLWDALRSGRYRPEAAAVSTYTYAIAHNVWLQRFRGRLHTAAPDGLPQPVVDEDLTDELAQAEQLEALRECIATGARLSPDERRLVRDFAGGASERELAGRLGVAASTINARKKAALEKLRQCMAAKGFTVGLAEQDAGSKEQ